MRRSPINRTPAKPHDGALLLARATTHEALHAGWRRVAENGGAAGADRVTCAAFAIGSQHRLAELQQELLSGNYRPGPLRHVEIDKPSGGRRRLSIPCVRDRVAQTAVAQTLSPLFEAEFEEVSFGYRPGRSVRQALRRVHELRKAGYVHTLDADIEGFFDAVPHEQMMERLLRSVSEGGLTDLIELWLETGADNGRGLAQGSPLSPLLANLYLDRLDEALMATPCRIVRYADDFLVLAKDRGGAEKSMETVSAVLRELGLRLHPQKTALRDYDQAVRFLGASFVRGMVLAGEEDADWQSEAETLLARIARMDREAEEACEQTARTAQAERQAGHDRTVRTLYLMEHGRRLDLKNLAFAIHGRGEADGDELLGVIHPTSLDRVEIGPHCDVTAEALRNALAFGVEVAFVNGHGETQGTLAGPLPQRATRHLAQARHALDPDLRLALARIFVEGRLRNQRALLRRVNQRRGFEEVDLLAARLGRVLRKLRVCKEVAGVMGVEGEATALYWRGYSALLMHGWSLPQRRRRPAPDPVNAALGLAGALLERDIRTVLLAAGLHPGFGFLHAVRDAGDALVFDMMEVFRTPLAESVVLEAFNRRLLRGEHVRDHEGGQRLTAEGQRILVRAYETRATSLSRSQSTEARAPWRRHMLDQARALASMLEGGPTLQPIVADY